MEIGSLNIITPGENYEEAKAPEFLDIYFEHSIVTSQTKTQTLNIKVRDTTGFDTDYRSYFFARWETSYSWFSHSYPMSGWNCAVPGAVREDNITMLEKDVYLVRFDFAVANCTGGPWDWNRIVTFDTQNLYIVNKMGLQTPLGASPSFQVRF